MKHVIKPGFSDHLAQLMKIKTNLQVSVNSGYRIFTKASIKISKNFLNSHWNRFYSSEDVNFKSFCWKICKT